MLNQLIGWHVGDALGANFDTIRFEVTVGAGSTSSPTKVSKTVADSVRGSEQKKRLTGGENFFVSNLYTLCEPGKVNIDVLPNNNTNNKISIVVFKPRLIELKIPKLLEVDLSIDFFNSEPQSNDVTIAFEGFWIPENQTPAFTEMSHILFRTLNDIDLQTLAMGNLLNIIGGKIDITNSLLINPKRFTQDQLTSISPPLPPLSITEEKAKLKRICGTGAPQDKEEEDE